MKTLNAQNPVGIMSGVGSRKDFVSVLPQDKNTSYLLVTTEGMLRRGTAQELMDSVPHTSWSVHVALPNPDLDTLDDAIAKLDAQKKVPFTAVIGLGGGSVMDSAKALACGLSQNAPQRPLHQWLRKGGAVNVKPLALYCLPTTAGTGSEVTPFATIWDHAEQKKRSLAGDYSFAKMAILDPFLTLSLPWKETLYGALDALSHALETLWNKNATPHGAKYAVQALKNIVENIYKVEKNPQDIQARAALQHGACCAGLAIAQSRTSLAHAISYPLTLHFGVPHGLACSAYLYPMMHFISKKDAWHPLLDEQTKASVLSLLNHYKPASLLREYAKAQDIAIHIDEMFSPERANTFCVPVTKEDVLSFIYFEEK